ncbi:MAG: glycosyl transferase [Acetatifactor sp.]|nr:glycosyl transferase [Acetatifactor sp.]
MSSVKTALKLLKTPDKMIAPLAQRGFFDWMSDEAFLKLRFRASMGYKLNLEHPRTYNEKLQWLKLYDKNPIYPQMVDKYRAKEYVASLIGEQYIIPTLGVYDCFEDIDFNVLPGQFVLKCTHDSGSIYICRDKNCLDRKRAEQILKRGLKRKPDRYAREWPYSQVQPRIIAEQYMEEESGQELMDYKIFTFSGKPALILVNYGKKIQHERQHSLYSPNWEHIKAAALDSRGEQEVPRPENLELMLELAGKLSQGLPHVRVDFYSIGSRVYFGELTLYHRGGFGKFPPPEIGLWMGEQLELPLHEKEV